jgi:hypothetical protein
MAGKAIPVENGQVPELIVEADVHSDSTFDCNVRDIRDARFLTNC